jgi:hypothetical protein
VGWVLNGFDWLGSAIQAIFLKNKVTYWDYWFLMPFPGRHCEGGGWINHEKLFSGVIFQRLKCFIPVEGF